MKRFSRRVTALLLALTMVFALAATAFAATVSWNGSDGLYTLTTTITSRNAQKTTACANAAQVYHDGTTATNIPVKTNYYADVKASVKGAYTPYQTYMDQVLRKDSAALVKTMTSGTVGVVTVPASKAAGYYKAAIVAVGLKGSYVLNLGETTNKAVSPQAMVLSNAITFAPVSKSGVGYIKVS